MLIKPEERVDQPIPDEDTSPSWSRERAKQLREGGSWAWSQEDPWPPSPPQPLPGISRPTVAPRADLAGCLRPTVSTDWLGSRVLGTAGPTDLQWAGLPLPSLGEGVFFSGKGRRPPGNVRGALGDELVQVMLDHLLSLEARDTSVPWKRAWESPITGSHPSPTHGYRAVEISRSKWRSAECAKYTPISKT